MDDAAAGQPPPPPASAQTFTEISAPDSRLAARMRDPHAAVQALAARGRGLRAIPRELAMDRKTARFAHATTSDEAVAGATPGPPCWTATSRTCTAGGTKAATTPPTAAEITALGYNGSLRTVYRYLQPLCADRHPAAPTRQR
jgi:hypothetical protein